MENLRILHFLSPVKWVGNKFLSDSDANFKVMKKTVEFLPNCHHYILMPKNATERLNQKNVTNIHYEYPHSVFLNRYHFDHKKVVGFNFDRLDVDFIFNHQPEQTLSLQVWFGSNRYYRDIHTFNFFHWIDCEASGGGFRDVQPINFLRQYEATVVGDVNFFHTKFSVDYLLSNFKKLNYTPEIKNIKFMPLSGDATGDKTAFKLPLNKKVVVFNHRWSKSSNTEQFLEYARYVLKHSDEYVFWITDEKDCDIKEEGFIVKALCYSDFNYLMSNCYCNVTFIKGYTTWNLSAQDCLIRNKPSLILEHDVTKEVCGPNASYFNSKDEFFNLLNELPESIDNDYYKKHDINFKNNLISSLQNLWKDTAKEPKKAKDVIKNIDKGVRTKFDILSDVHDSIISNGSNHGIRRYILHNGYKDDINSVEPRYFKNNETITEEFNLFTS